MLLVFRRPCRCTVYNQASLCQASTLYIHRHTSSVSVIWIRFGWAYPYSEAHGAHLPSKPFLMGLRPIMQVQRNKQKPKLNILALKKESLYLVRCASDILLRFRHIHDRFVVDARPRLGVDCFSIYFYLFYFIYWESTRAKATCHTLFDTTRFNSMLFSILTCVCLVFA